MYRYQLLPIDRHTGDLYDGRTTQELIQQKNEIFAKAIPFIRTYRHRGSDLSVRIDSSSNSAFVLSIASQRALTRETPDFRVEQVDNWPHTVAIVLNREDEQYVAVQDRPSAFASTDTVINLIEKATRSSLARSASVCISNVCSIKVIFGQLLRITEIGLRWLDLILSRLTWRIFQVRFLAH